MEKKITDDLDVLLAVLPPDIEMVVRKIGQDDELLEIILDLGRRPAVRYTDGERILNESPVNKTEIEYVETRVSEFDTDNRAGIERTLHRISAIRNRRGDVIGLTCRVGRAVYGTIDIIQDIVESGQSVMLLGRLVWAKRPCCARRLGSWLKRNGLLSWTHLTRSAVTVMCHIRQSAAPAGCKCPCQLCSTR